MTQENRSPRSVYRCGSGCSGPLKHGASGSSYCHLDSICSSVSATVRASVTSLVVTSSTSVDQLPGSPTTLYVVVVSVPLRVSTASVSPQTHSDRTHSSHSTSTV